MNESVTLEETQAKSFQFSETFAHLINSNTADRLSEQKVVGENTSMYSVYVFYYTEHK